MKQIICILLICLVVALIAGCKAAEKEAPAGSTSADVSDVEDGISDIDAVDSDLNIDELDELDKELEDISW